MRNYQIFIILSVAWLAIGSSLAQAGITSDGVDAIIAQILNKPKPAAQQQAAAAKPPAKAVKAPLPVVMDVRIGEHADRTRFVVELSDPVDFRPFTLGNPNRVVIDLPQVAWKLSGPPRPSGQGVVRGYRYGPFRPGTSRFVIDLGRPARMAEALVIPPENGFGYRYVLDLFPTEQAKFDKKAGWPHDLKARELAADRRLADLPPTPKTARKVVVIDPGHGGIDPGTVGVGGTKEKDIVLAVGLSLSKVLISRGYRVHMTRTDDTFIPLRQRVRLARTWHADLMVSIHVDSHPNPQVSGLSIYTLSEKSSDKEAAALTAKENQSDIIAGVDLSGENSDVAPILIDLAQRDTMNKSSRFAEKLLAEAANATDILPHRPHRSGGLVVLKAPDVPSVLVELGYLSNRHNAAQMLTNRWRQRISAAIASAIDKYFASQSQARAGRNDRRAP